MDDFDTYIKQGEPNQKAKADAWDTAIGLQQTDDLKTSDYLVDVAKQNIEGNITIEEVKNRDLHIRNTPNMLGVNDAKKLGVKLSNNQIKLLSLLKDSSELTIKNLPTYSSCLIQPCSTISTNFAQADSLNVSVAIKLATGK